MPEIRFQITDALERLLQQRMAVHGIDRTELARRYMVGELMRDAGEQSELLSAGERPGSLSDDKLRVIGSMDGQPLMAIVAELERRGIETARGGKWTATTVARALERARARGLTSTDAGEHQEPEAEPEPEPAPKRRGRPPKSTSAAAEPERRKPGRPPKSAAAESAPKPGRKPGRPRKDAAQEPAKRRGPGRPRKAQGKAPKSGTRSKRGKAKIGK